MTTPTSPTQPAAAPTAPAAAPFSFGTFLGGMVVGLVVGLFVAAYFLPMIEPLLSGGGKVSTEGARKRGGAVPQPTGGPRDPVDPPPATGDGETPPDKSGAEKPGTGTPAAPAPK